jgi:putative peptidoglycan lipid II flippase
MRSSLVASLRGALLLSLPASVGLILLREPVIVLLYQRGEFGPDSTRLVSWALLWFAAGMVGHAMVEILSRAFYSLHDTRTPVAIGAAAMAVNILLSYLFSALFLRIGWAGHGGLALANSTATALEAGALFMLMHRKLGGLDGRRLLRGAVQAGAATLAMAAGVWSWLALTRVAPNLWSALGGAAVGGVIYAVVILSLGVGEAQWMLHALKRRLAR